MTNHSLVLRHKNAAAMLDISIATFWRMVKSGKLQTISIGSDLI
jgi:predicted DNA-binding transcriptional regulator AlpA